MQHDNGQLGLWPGSITLSGDFYETLREHAVPLDPRAIGALQNSALALDTYTWLAHRLCRVKQNRGVTLYWKNLKDQFGQEYRSDKDFKREFSGALRKAHAVYPDAKMEFVRGGLRLFPSPPPVKRRQVVVALPPRCGCRACDDQACGYAMVTKRTNSFRSRPSCFTRCAGAST